MLSITIVPLDHFDFGFERSGRAKRLKDRNYVPGSRSDGVKAARAMRYKDSGNIRNHSRKAIPAAGAPNDTAPTNLHVFASILSRLIYW